MDQTVFQNIRTLEAMAHDRTEDGKEALAGAISDLIKGSDSTLTDRERMLMSEILRELVRGVESSARKALAQRLAQLPNAPHDIILMLANDEIEIAHPILVNSPQLQDAELIEIIRHRTEEHQLAITIRNSISVDVSDALVGTGNQKVVKKLLENSGAALSQKTIEYLVEQSQRVDAYQYPLLHRRELGPDLATRMYAWVSEALRSHIAQNFNIDPAILEEATRGVARDLSLSHPPPHSKAEALVEEVMRQGQMTPTLIVNALQEGELALFYALLAKYTRVSELMIRRILLEEGGQSLAVLCRGTGIDKGIFCTILTTIREKRSGGGRMGLAEFSSVLRFFDRITPEAAAGMVKKWQAGVANPAKPGGAAA